MKNRIVFSIGGLICCGFCLVLSNQLLAQTAEQKLQHLAQVLNLSAEQKGEMLPILQQEGPKLEAIKNNPNLTGPQKAMQLRAVHQQTDPQVKGILSPQQYQEWQTIRQHEIEQAIKRKTEGPE
jgi:periplasmic protein CpxP/Spy